MWTPNARNKIDPLAWHVKALLFYNFRYSNCHAKSRTNQSWRLDVFMIASLAQRLTSVLSLQFTLKSK